MLFVYPVAHVVKSAREASLENNPVAHTPEINAAVGAPLVAYLHALADLIEAGQAHPDLVGFDGVRGLLDGIAIALPESEEQDAAISALMGLLTVEEPALIDEDGTVNPNALPDEPTEDMGK